MPVLHRTIRVSGEEHILSTATCGWPPTQARERHARADIGCLALKVVRKPTIVAVEDTNNAIAAARSHEGIVRRDAHTEHLCLVILINHFAW